ncbi:hypothetical protein HDU93_004850 [Gonapodya sp. JEL0774]|nr:hypothetical protein HDU93_004850 [Gonapodya sp. JEL0774]
MSHAKGTRRHNDSGEERDADSFAYPPPAGQARSEDVLGYGSQDLPTFSGGISQNPNQIMWSNDRNGLYSNGISDSKQPRDVTSLEPLNLSSQGVSLPYSLDSVNSTPGNFSAMASSAENNLLSSLLSVVNSRDLLETSSLQTGPTLSPFSSPDLLSTEPLGSAAYPDFGTIASTILPSVAGTTLCSQGSTSTPDGSPPQVADPLIDSFLLENPTPFPLFMHFSEQILRNNGYPNIPQVSQNMDFLEANTRQIFANYMSRYNMPLPAPEQVHSARLPDAYCGIPQPPTADGKAVRFSRCLDSLPSPQVKEHLVALKMVGLVDIDDLCEDVALVLRDKYGVLRKDRKTYRQNRHLPQRAKWSLGRCTTTETRN